MPAKRPTDLPALKALTPNQSTAFDHWLKLEMRLFAIWAFIFIGIGIWAFLFNPLQFAFQYSDIGNKAVAFYPVFILICGIYLLWYSTQTASLQRALLQIRVSRERLAIFFCGFVTLMVVWSGISLKLTGNYLLPNFGITIQMMMLTGRSVWRLGQIAKIERLGQAD